MSRVAGREQSLGIGVEEGQRDELLAVAGTGGEGGGGLSGVGGLQEVGCSCLDPYPVLWGGPFNPWLLSWNGWDPPASSPSAFLTEIPPETRGRETALGWQLSDASFPSSVLCCPYSRGCVGLLLAGKGSQGDNCVS